jgi:hypothetical protein
MALRLSELEESYTLLFTPTGNELPDLRAHIDRVVAVTGAPLVEITSGNLFTWIEEFGALPNWRQRWCTRLLKIQPCIAYLAARPGSTLAVGLRADEEARQGLYGEHCTYRYPLREWGWGMSEVVSYCKSRGVLIPPRTDCALCYGQRLGEWYRLWQQHPEEYARGEALEAKHGHTFRSPGRDTWPAGLVQLRAKFEAGSIPRGVPEDGSQACRVCKL